MSTDDDQKKPSNPLAPHSATALTRSARPPTHPVIAGMTRDVTAD